MFQGSDSGGRIRSAPPKRRTTTRDCPYKGPWAADEFVGEPLVGSRWDVPRFRFWQKHLIYPDKKTDNHKGLSLQRPRGADEFVGEPLVGSR